MRFHEKFNYLWKYGQVWKWKICMYYKMMFSFERNMRMGWSGAERGETHKSRRSEREKEQARKWDETIECAEERETMALVRVASRKRIITGGNWTSNCCDMKWAIEVHPNREERGKEQEGKKENRKIIIYIYILFSFMYARNCKNGESYCRPLAFLCLFFALCTVESTHAHTSSSTSTS